ncbi:hypothetical protein HMN09_00368000 [Mycena chlorophos]|uniref:PIPK domain-containing protein n=1 Tax=Mycena chlorophos TaxID=658473 RepID=A0A8H6TJS5_MYCCL|nr:hypothetical protein HMN09_00368000 [Mycena chlorophos]
MSSLLIFFLFPVLCLYRIFVLLFKGQSQSRDEGSAANGDQAMPPTIGRTTAANTKDAPATTTDWPWDTAEPLEASFPLAKDAHEHRGRLLRALLDEEGFDMAPLDLDGDEGDGEAWAAALEGALDVLGGAVGRGEWLAGPRARARRRRTSTDALSTIRMAVSALATPSGSSSESRRHLLLCVGGAGKKTRVIPREDDGFELVRASVRCGFRAGVFEIPGDNAEAREAVLCGLDEWDSAATYKPRLVGGTFYFKGVVSPEQHAALVRVLRIAVYIQFSLVLEQAFLADSGIPLVFPSPSPKPKPAPAPAIPSEPSLSNNSDPATRDRRCQVYCRRRSSSRAAGPVAYGQLQTLPTSSRFATPTNTGTSRLRGFSLLSPTMPSSPSLAAFGFGAASAATASTTSGNPFPFTAIHDKLLASASLLSTSADVTVAPPTIITQLADAERQHASNGPQTGKRRLKGDERVALASVRGWGDAPSAASSSASSKSAASASKESKEAKAAALVGSRGFVGMQEMSVLVSWGVPGAGSASVGPSSLSGSLASLASLGSGSSSSASASFTGAGAEGDTSPTSSPSLAASASAPAADITQCLSPRIQTLRFYRASDRTLGEVVHGWCREADGGGCRHDVFGDERVRRRKEKGKEVEVDAGESGDDERDRDRDGSRCAFRRSDHVLRLVHGGMRVEVRVGMDVGVASAGAVPGPGNGNEPPDGDGMPNGRTGNEGTIETWLSCAVCGKRTDRKGMSDASRHLSFGKFLELLIYSPALSRISPTICDHTGLSQISSSELPLSRLSIVRHFSSMGHVVSFALAQERDVFELRVPRLRVGKALGLGGRERAVPVATSSEEDKDKKVLRREVTSWWTGLGEYLDKLEQSVTSLAQESTSESTPPLRSGLPPTALSTPHLGKLVREYFPSSSSTTDPIPTLSPDDVAEVVGLLGSLRRSFGHMEEELYVLLGNTPVALLNDVRRAFVAKAKGAERRVLAWEVKHLRKRGLGLGLEEPEWWKRGWHVPPSSNVLVREDDWGSVIAFAMSNPDYTRELATLSLGRPGMTASTPSIETIPTTATNTMSSSQPLLDPDPDDNDAIWYAADSFSAVVSRRANPREASSVLSIRQALRSKPSLSNRDSLYSASSPLVPSQMQAQSRSRFNKPSSLSRPAPTSAWSKPDVRITKEDAGGEVARKVGRGGAGKMLHGIEASASASASVLSVSGTEQGEQQQQVRPRLKQRVVSSVAVMSDDEDVLSEKEAEVDAGKENEPKNENENEKQEARKNVKPPPLPPPTSFAGSLSNGFSSAWRFILSPAQIPRPALFSLSKDPHTPIDIFAIDDQPHIKHTWTLAGKLRFSCTVYYAKQFDGLRRRCGLVDGDEAAGDGEGDVFLRSLAKSANWAADGGKSRSDFWRTEDGRFVIKTLVNAWNVADLQVLLDLAPSYFRYMDASASRATALAKLVGFYTVEIRNLENGGVVQSRADLLVMENVFYRHEHAMDVARTFDLKGIMGRRAPVRIGETDASKARTLFDADWLDTATRILVSPYSKAVLREALRNDADFLAQGNIMDYSLLLGIDFTQKQIACGLVDTIGSYTFAKTLEYKAKRELNAYASATGTGPRRVKEVTVLPPAEYQERFVRALLDGGYFDVCPDRWTRAEDVGHGDEGREVLPSVL